MYHGHGTLLTHPDEEDVFFVLHSTHSLGVKWLLSFDRA